MVYVVCGLVVTVAGFHIPVQAQGQLIQHRGDAWMVDFTEFYKQNTAYPHDTLVQIINGNRCLVIKGVLGYDG